MQDNQVYQQLPLLFTQQPGETAEQFAQRQAQAQQFQITKAGMAELAPQVAAQDALQTAALQQAVDPTTGLGSFQPFLTKADSCSYCSNRFNWSRSFTTGVQQDLLKLTLHLFNNKL